MKEPRGEMPRSRLRAMVSLEMPALHPIGTTVKISSTDLEAKGFRRAADTREADKTWHPV